MAGERITGQLFEHQNFLIDNNGRRKLGEDIDKRSAVMLPN